MNVSCSLTMYALVLLAKVHNRLGECQGIHLITTGESLSSLTLKRLEQRKNPNPGVT